MEVVDGVQLGAEDFVAFVEMVEVGAAVVAAGVAVAGGVEWAGVGFVAGVADAEQALAGEQMAVARVAGGHDAVEQVDSFGHGLDDVLRSADSHQVARAVRRHPRGAMAHHARHLLLGLAHRKPADGIAGKTEFKQAGERPVPQFGVHAALDDAEQRGGMAAVGAVAAPGPAQRQFHRFARLRGCRRIGGAVVENHDHIGAKPLLQGDGGFRAEEDALAIDRRAERHAFLADLAHGAEAEDLETAGIGEDRPVPAHEAVQAAVGFDDFRAGAQHQVEAVGENHVGAGFPHLPGVQALHRAVGAHRHERGGAHLAAGEAQHAGPRRAVALFEFESHGGQLSRVSRKFTAGDFSIARFRLTRLGAR